MADALSRVEAVTTALDYEQLAQSHSTDEKLKQFLTASVTSWQLKIIKSIGGDNGIYCDISTDVCRPFVTPAQTYIRIST